MPAHPAPRIADAFADLVDPRVERTKRHRLLDILTITRCGVLCGAENWVEIADWADAKRAWLTDWLGLDHGTLGRVFDRLDPVQVEAGSCVGSKARSRRTPTRWSPSTARPCGARETPIDSARQLYCSSACRQLAYRRRVQAAMLEQEPAG